MNILGLNAYHGDASAALFGDGRLACAMEEERFSRLKHQAGFPALAVAHSLAYAGPWPARSRSHRDLARSERAHSPQADVRAVAGAAPRRRFATGSRTSRGFATSRRRWPKSLGVDEVALAAQVHRVEHHHAHMASSFFVSPFERAALLSIDGFGDFVSTMWGTRLRQQDRGRGLGRVSALDGAPLHGHHPVPRVPEVRRRVQGDGPCAVRRAGVSRRAPQARPREARRRLRAGSLLLRAPQRRRQHDVGQRARPRSATCFRQARTASSARAAGRTNRSSAQHHNIAASLQALLEEVVLGLLRHDRRRRPDSKDLCLAGGVALNCTMNGKIRRDAVRARLHPAGRLRCRHLARRRAVREAPDARRAARLRHGSHLLGPRVLAARRAARRSTRSGLAYRELPTRRSPTRRPRSSPRATSSAGTRAASSGARARSATAASSAIRATASMKDHLNQPDQAPRGLPAVRAVGARGACGRLVRHGRRVAVHADDLPGAREQQARVPAITHVDGTARQQTVSRRPTRSTGR